MSEKFQDWLAGVYEYRLALIVAASGSLLVVVLMLVSSWMISQPPRAGIEKKSPSPSFHLPPRPPRTAPRPAAGEAPTPAAIDKPTAVARPQSPPAPAARTIGNPTVPAGYYVQAGAFRSPQRASTRLQRLKSAGWPARRLKKKNGLHAVLIGPYSARKGAEGARKKLAAVLHIQSFILRIEEKR